jgi:hypothetical protein
MRSMPNVIDRYMQADAAFAALHRDATPGVPRSEEEWRIYREWADATSDYLLFVDAHQDPTDAVPRALARIRRILRARPAPESKAP